jgi:hypothetical protein
MVLNLFAQFVKIKSLKKVDKIAQLVERFAVNEGVPGSNPGFVAKISNYETI